MEVGGSRPPSLRVSLSRRRRLLVRRLPAELLAVVLVLLAVAPVVLRVLLAVVLVQLVRPVVALRVLVLLLALWGLGSPRGRRSWVPVWARPGAWPISPLATLGRRRWRLPALRDRRERKVAGARRAEGALVAVGRRVAAGVVSQRERERCIGDECCC